MQHKGSFSRFRVRWKWDRPGRGDRSAQRGRSVIYYCLVLLWKSLPHAVNCVKFCFSDVCNFFVCLWISGTAERICAKLTGKTCLVPRLDAIECQDQRSKVKIIRDKFPPHWKCIEMRSLKITSCSKRDHSIATRGGDDSAETALAKCDLCCGLRSVYVW